MQNAHIPPVQHLALFRASRVERLLVPMQILLRSQGPAHPLAPVQVVVGHAGLRPWLLGQLARDAGREGIAANIDVMLPSTWLERLAQDVLGESAVALAPYRREILRWRIHALLPQVPLVDVQAYLDGGDAARRRFQLADHLAGLFGRYSIYRPDWLAAWAHGNDRIPAEARASPLPWLWKRLRIEIGQPHRGERLQQLAEALAEGHPAAAGDGSALHLFGISHLAPGELAVFAALSAQRPVALYLPDPCRERDWVLGLPADRAWLHAAWASEQPDQADAAFLAQPHPLLAAWGRMGQEFLLALEDHQLLADVRDASDAEDSNVEAGNRLQRLQDSLRRRDVTLLAPTVTQAEERKDTSLRVHACHTRLRELEVLRDALLDVLARSPDLTAADIVVMAPDITAYAPLLPAVFGEPGVADAALPYHLADIPLTAAHPLLQAYAHLLDLPLSRLPVAEVLDLLRTPAVMLRFGLDAGGVARIEGWLRQANVVWALDAAQRVREGLPDNPTHSFAWGVDRLLAAHVFGHVDDAVALPEGSVLPAEAAIEGPQAGELGALDSLLALLAEWQRDATQPRLASAWAKRMEVQLDALFRVSLQDAAGNEALGVLRGLVRDVADVPGKAGVDPQLDYAVVREVLQEGLQAVPARQRFLSGSMVVCGMVPQRAIPFRVVAVLGLDEGAFPRPDRSDGLDLMARHRRSGDRGLRDDDRWLFLETVMAARERLHLSYIGEDVRDGKSRNPAAPLAELMAVLDRHAPPQPCAEGETPNPQRPWLVRHPLQPFDPRYFDGGDDADPALFSHRDAFATASNPGQEIPPIFADLLKPLIDGSAVMPPATPLPIAAVLGYFRDPARQLLRDGLGLRLDASDQFEVEEPLDATLPAIARLPQRLLRMAIEKQLTTMPEHPPAWLADAGLLASGRPGVSAWLDLREKTDATLQQAVALPLFEHGWPKPWPAIEAAVGQWQLSGRLPDVVVGPDGAPCVLALQPGKKLKELDYAKRIPLFLQWALLRLDPALAERPVEIVWLLKEPPGDDAPWQAWAHAWQQADVPLRKTMHARLAASVIDLLVLFVQAQQQPSAYFPKTTFARDPAAAWAGGFGGKGERDYAPGYARLLAGEVTFADEAEQTALQVVAERIEAALALPLGDAA
ncbi:exodeoxyribonuclease V subunit gamma [Thermomonas sp.]|uniref:exodeoxyribonuclease V subunit gamma n=1 Tax=Thermomonas sp. TaxID=1971895 RepID=UPI002487D5F3|nr:exodeoxyribonuclease V subunit gamma [Thermomonas sp.]MDI1252298.1 exodeoxyribonuclease V subunit gamma [Thermomonas sp.]